MKTWIIIVCLPIICIAQLQIKGEPELLQGEIVAKRDANGRHCAALQVVSSLDGFSYESYNGVVEVDDKPGMDMVYVSPDERVLQIYHTGFEPLKIILSEVGIVLKPRQVWRINISGEKTAEKLPVLIMTNPKDADIWIDGKKQPKKENYIVGIGEHDLTVRKEGFETWKEKIVVDAEHMVFRISLNKVRDALVEINSEPSGAVVWLDGVKLGETPLSRFYPPGRYNIKIEKEKYLELEETIEIRTPLTRQNYQLEKNAAWLTIKTSDAATVYLDNKRIRTLNRIELEPSVVAVRVEMSKAEPMTRQVTLKRGDHKVIEMIPQVPTGTIRVAVTPFDAEVELVGDAGERFTSKGSHVFGDIPVGKYKMTIKASGYARQQQVISLMKNEMITRSIKLEPDSDGEIVTDIGGKTVTDIDGNVYKTIKIGNQLWMAENLKVTHYRNGDPIPNVTDDDEWKDLSSGARCIYDNNTSNLSIYGRLYNWYAVNDSRGLAPEGWHIPTDEEWKELEMYLGTNEGSKLAGNPALWKDGDLKNNNAFRESGFSALPGGYRNSYDGNFYDMGYSATFWSASEDYNVGAWYRYLSYHDSDITRSGYYKLGGFSVRCLRE